MVCIDAVSRGSADDGSDIGEQIGAPVGSKPASDLSIGSSCRPQFSFTAIIIGRRIGMREKGEQVAADFAIAFTKTPSVLIDGSQSHDLVEFAIEPLLIGPTRLSARLVRRRANITARSSSAFMRGAKMASPASMANVQSRN